ncbi:genetic competence negative regulator [Ornithinibacillus halotolerans]|uniref:Adapter protein MecA 2 n=1 Tax=Ornithinibacillus halotolerans TaxID=1274357 RepID=A0A916RLZ4_9BACI|nr:genetic competence negative regulator [Ornithinibacillus halotolerans]GGA61099.1 adapter protein MecA 2 [Ornithinibacillus halotolerans]
MRIERVSSSQFTIFLTFDDLVERGFNKEEFLHDATSIQNLFTDVMYEASSELGFELEGKLNVQVLLMQAQGMHVIVTQNCDTIDWDEDVIEMKVTLDESKELIFSFDDFEDVIQVSSYLSKLAVSGGQVFHMGSRYYMLLNQNELNGNHKENIIALMSEFANPSIVTSYRLKEYGKIIIQSNAIETIVNTFDS